MKKGFLCVMLMVLLVLATGIVSAKEYKIGISIPSADHGWTGGIVWWAQEAIKDLKVKNPDLSFELVTARSASEQVSNIEDLMIKDIDALVVLAQDSASLTPMVKKAASKGIYIVSVDRGLTEPVEDLYIAGDNPGFGRASAEWMAKALHGKGKIVVLEGIPCVVNTERVQAFDKVMEQYKGIKILDSQPSDWSTQKGLSIMENYLQKYNHIDAVWAGDDDVLKGVLQAYKESGRTDIKFFMGGGGSKDIIKMVRDGSKLVPADVTYPPSMIATGIGMAVKALKGEQIDGFYQHELPTKIILRSELVTQENAVDYYYPDNVY